MSNPELLDGLIELRRQLHRRPEVGLDLPETQETVLRALEGLPLEITTGAGLSSVTAVLRGGSRDADRPTTVLLRGDMDALPVRENTGLEYAATNGAMHACGHDLHTAGLVGAARLLCERRDELAGDVVFMFQPGEEGHDGAELMVKEGVLEASGHRVDHAYGLHVTGSTIPRGVFAGRPGTVMAAAWTLGVTVHGAGGHGSMPHTTRDPIHAMAEQIAALQSMITRRFDVFDPIVLSVGRVSAGTAFNVIPDTARFDATVRAFSPEAEARLQELIPPLLREIAAAHGCEVEVELTPQFPTTVNDPDEAAFVGSVLRRTFGADRYVEMPRPASGSEDFSLVLDEVPGAYFFLGAHPEGVDPTIAPSNHSAEARFDDALLSEAATALAALAAGRLAPTAGSARTPAP